MKKILSALFALLLVLSLLTGCGKKGTNSGLSLSLSWKATQSGEKCKIEVSLYLDYEKAELDAYDKNSFVLNGETYTFPTPAISSALQGNALLCRYETELTRTPGTTASCPVSATFRVGREVDGTEVGWLNLTEVIRIDDSSVNGGETEETAAPISDDTKPSAEGTETVAATEPAEPQPIETKPAETKPIETEPAETEPAETEPKETEPVETEPSETEPAETDSEETEPVETEPAAEEPEIETIHLKNGTAAWRITSNTGTKLNLVADCYAELINGTVEIRTDLSIAHNQISCDSRKGNLLNVAGETTEFVSEILFQDVSGTTETYLAGITASAEIGEKFTVQAVFHYNGIYHGKQIGDITVNKIYVIVAD